MRCTLLLAAVLAVVVVGIGVCDCADEGTRVVLQFEKPYQAYRAVCTISYPGPLTVVVEKGGRAVRRFAIKTLTEPMCIKPVRLQARRGPDLQGLFVQCSGGSASHDYVFEISPRRARKLMYGLDKWGVDFGYDPKGRLRGMRFHYWRWHVDTEYGLRGHVLTAIDYTWLLSRRTFREGGVHVDSEAEAKAGLADVLEWAVMDDFSVSLNKDEPNNRITFFYKPTGILRAKTPRELQNAPRVKAVVHYSDRRIGYGYDLRLVSIARAPDR